MFTYADYSIQTIKDLVRLRNRSINPLSLPSMPREIIQLIGRLQHNNYFMFFGMIIFLEALAVPVFGQTANDTLIDPVPTTLYTQLPDEELGIWMLTGFNDNYTQTDTLFRVILPDTGATATWHDTTTALPRPLVYGYDPSIPYADVTTTVLTSGRYVNNHADQIIGFTQTAYDPNVCDYGQYTYAVGGFMNSAISTDPIPGYTFEACALENSISKGNGILNLSATSGDLDRLADSSGHFHDEAVVAYINEEDYPIIQVLDYATPDTVLPTSVVLDQHLYDPAYTILPNSFPYPEAVDLATYSATRVGGQYIVTVHSAKWKGDSVLPTADSLGIVLHVLQYTPASNDTSATLTVVDSAELLGIHIPDEESTEGGAQVVAADFTGDGTDEFAIGYYLFEQGAPELRIEIFDYEPDTGLVQLDSRTVVATNSVDYVINHLQITPGLFYFNPDDGFGLGRRQLAVAWKNEGGNNLGLQIFRIGVDGNIDSTLVTRQDAITGLPFVENYGSAAGFYQIVAGNFIGDQKPITDEPTWDIVVYPGASIDSLFWFDSALNTIGKQHVPKAARFWMTPFDYDGNSLYLGAPVVFSADAPVQALSILHQPPQHLDYLPKKQESSTLGLLNVSRKPGITLNFSQAYSSSLSSNQQSSSSFALGASGAASAGLTLTEKVPLLEKASIGGTISANLEDAFNNSSLKNAGESDQKTVTLSDSPDFDDGLTIVHQPFQIWRYRLYEAQANNPGQPIPYYEVYVPSGSAQLSVGLSGITVDGYQPIHENGNILSYPPATGGTYVPPNLGSWQPSSSECAPPPSSSGSSPPLTNPVIVGIDGNSNEITVSLTEAVICNQNIETKNTLKAALDLKVNLDLKGSDVFEKVTATGAFSVGINTGVSWADLSSWNAQVTTSENLAINTVAFADLNWDYSIMPTLYVSDSGNLNVNFSVDTPSKTGNWWSNTYQNPDPALNLPQKYISADNGATWTFNTLRDAQAMRGFFLRTNDPDPSNGLGPLLAKAPLWGDTVQVQIWVYNYSVGSSVDSIPVRFDIADYDETTNVVSNRRTLDTVTAVYTNESVDPDGPVLGTEFSPRGVGRAIYLLDTSTLPEADGDYLIYAVIDPDRTMNITETHGWRSQDLYIQPLTATNPGGSLGYTIYDDVGTPVDTVTFTPKGTLAIDIDSLAAAFTRSSLNSVYGITATPVPQPPPSSASPVYLTLSTDNAAYLPSNRFEPGLAFADSVNGTSALYFEPTDPSSLFTTNLALGQNNAGFGYLSVHLQDTTGANPAVELMIRPDALAARDHQNGQLKTDAVTARLNTPLEMRICAQASASYAGYVSVSIWSEQDGEEAGIALKQFQGINGDQGSCRWFHWMPQTTGEHTIHARLYGRGTQLTDEITITVED